MASPERMAELMFDLLRLRKAEKGRYPVDWLPSWSDLPSLSKAELTLLFREMSRLLALDEEEARSATSWRSR